MKPTNPHYVIRGALCYVIRCILCYVIRGALCYVIRGSAVVCQIRAAADALGLDWRFGHMRSAGGGRPRDQPRSRFARRRRRRFRGKALSRRGTGRRTAPRGLRDRLGEARKRIPAMHDSYIHHSPTCADDKTDPVLPFCIGICTTSCS